MEPTNSAHDPTMLKFGGVILCMHWLETCRYVVCMDTRDKQCKSSDVSMDTGMIGPGMPCHSLIIPRLFTLDCRQQYPTTIA